MNREIKFRAKDFKYDPPFTPYYMEGSNDSHNYIRTTKNVSSLFQNKLCKKWDNDKEKGREPKWTKRGVPEFYKTI